MRKKLLNGSRANVKNFVDTPGFVFDSKQFVCCGEIEGHHTV